MAHGLGVFFRIFHCIRLKKRVLHMIKCHVLFPKNTFNQLSSIGKKMKCTCDPLHGNHNGIN